MNLSLFKKTQLREILSGHFREAEIKSCSKKKMIDMIVEHNIPMTIEYNKNTSKILLLSKCEKFPEFVKRIHGKSKTTLLDFIQVQEEKSREKFTENIKRKLQQCFQSLAPFDVDEEELIQEIDNCLPSS